MEPLDDFERMRIIGVVFQDGGKVTRLRLLALSEAGISFKVSSGRHETIFFFLLTCVICHVFSALTYVLPWRKGNKSLISKLAFRDHKRGVQL